MQTGLEITIASFIFAKIKKKAENTTLRDLTRVICQRRESSLN